MTFTFTVDNPRHVIAYNWDFGDGSAISNEESPVHTYPGPGSYIVTLTLQSTCGAAVFTRASNVVGIKQSDIPKEALLITPNPSFGDVTILNRSSFKMKQIEIYEISGRVICEQKADSEILHNMHTKYLSGGVYLVKIITDGGIVIRKLQLLK